MTENLKAQFDAARLAGDADTMARIGRVLYPEPGVSVPRPDDHASVGGSAPPPMSPPETLQETTIRAERLAQLEGELAMVLLPTARRHALEAEREAILRADAEALASYAPEPAPPPTTVTFAEGTAEPVKNAFCALALGEGVSRSDAQGVLDQLAGARWLPPAECRRELAKDWGASLEANLALADRMVRELPWTLQIALVEHEADGTRFSPEVARALVAWGQRRRGGPR